MKEIAWAMSTPPFMTHRIGLGHDSSVRHDSSSEGEPVGEQSKLIGLALNVTYSSRVIHLEMVQLPCRDRRTGTKKTAGTSYIVTLA